MKTLISGVLMLMMSIAPAFADSFRKQERKISEVNAIAVSAGINVYVSKGKSDRVRIESTIEDFNNIVIKQSGKKLTIGYNSQLNNKFRKQDIKTNVYLSAEELIAISASSASKVSSTDLFKSTDFTAEASSAATIKVNIEATNIKASATSASDINLNFKAQNISLSCTSSADIDAKGECTTLKGAATSAADLDINVNCQNVTLSGTSSADIKAEGKCNQIDISASSAADIKAAKLIAVNATVVASSGADISVYASGLLSAKASSGSDIYYAGNPKNKNNSASSGGSIKPMK